jgi:hypothetical protein
MAVRAVVLLVLLFPRGSKSMGYDMALTGALALPAVLSVAADAWLRRRGSDGARRHPPMASADAPGAAVDGEQG